MMTDALLWIPVRTFVYDAIRVDLFDSGAAAEVGGLCGSGI